MMPTNPNPFRPPLSRVRVGAREYHAPLSSRSCASRPCLAWVSVALAPVGISGSLAMFDTVRLPILRGRWPEGVSRNFPTGWAWTGAKDFKFPLGYRSFPQFKHIDTGLRIIGGFKPTAVEFSLPRMLFGSNGVQLRSQGQVDAGLEIALSIEIGRAHV